jgi:hypothetical protein
MGQLTAQDAPRAVRPRGGRPTLSPRPQQGGDPVFGIAAVEEQRAVVEEHRVPDQSAYRAVARRLKAVAPAAQQG